MRRLAPFALICLAALAVGIGRSAWAEDRLPGRPFIGLPGSAGKGSAGKGSAGKDGAHGPGSAESSVPSGAGSHVTGLVTGTQVKGWQAVGKLLLGERGFCTAALIEPQLILTAAHCLYDKETGARTPDSLITFQPGWRNGRADAYRGIRRSVAHPDYIYSGDDELERVGTDLALLELDRPIQLPQMRPYEIGDPPELGDAVSVVSYAKDRSEIPSIERDCRVIGAETTALVLSCDIDFGSSGAPVFAVADGQAKVVSVISAKAELSGQKVALAVPVGEPLKLLREMLAGRPVQAETARGVRIMSGGDGTGGAKFVRP